MAWHAVWSQRRKRRSCSAVWHSMPRLTHELWLNHPLQDFKIAVMSPVPSRAPQLFIGSATKPQFFPFQVSDRSLPICHIPSISLNALCTGSDLPPSLTLPTRALLAARGGEIVLSNIDPTRAKFSFSLTELIYDGRLRLTSALIANLLLS